MKHTFQRILSILLCLVLVASYLPASIFSVVAEGTTPLADEVSKAVDPSTKDDWQQFFGTDTDFTTENAGGVWTDKSVFEDASDFSNITTDSKGNAASIAMTGTNSILVTLSAMASNMSVTGQAEVPTDSILVLDLSGSMNGYETSNNDVGAELAEAANTTIKTLLDSNENSRVGVILYSGDSGTGSSNTNADASVVLLPLGRYTTSDSQGRFVNYTREENRYWYGTEIYEEIAVNSAVRIEGTNTRPTITSKEISGATYTQHGVITAMNQFNAVQDISPGNVAHKPVLVLMSDGTPTLGSTTFTAPARYNLGTGRTTGSTAGLGFVTQLSCAYAKTQIEAKYGCDMLFYTLGLGTTQSDIATSVLDPANSISALDEFWTQYTATATDLRLGVGDDRNGNPQYVTKIATPLEQNYVDRYFAVDSSTGDLGQGLIDAFGQIVSDIQLQSKFTPTLVESNDDVSGYISFVDRIGSYMQVTDMKGILLQGQLFSGADMASNFTPTGGGLGSVENPTTLGDNLVWSIMERLNIPDAVTVRSLIGNAYQYGQLYYNSNSDFSNYIGWYANAAGDFLGFYQEGVTTLPAATGNAATDPVYTVKSYLYQGDTDPAQGVQASDMLYITARVRRNIATGEEQVNFAIPAALIPVVSYEVDLNEQGAPIDIQKTGADYPIRLIYEVGLDPRINELNVNDIISNEYKTHAKANGDKAFVNSDGTISFYTNKFDVDGQTGYNTNNAYSYFNPSRQNDKYYYTQNAPIYQDAQGTLYTGSTHPKDYNGTLYRSYVVYEKNGALTARTVYRPLSDRARGTAHEAAEGWYIASGNVHVNLEGYMMAKDSNNTGTLTWSNQPFVDAENHTVDDTGYNFVVGTTHGNNGRITLTPATGIKLTKAMAEGAAANGTDFAFTIANLTETAASGSFAAILETADGTQTATTVTFENGKAAVTLKAGQSLYITGMTAGTQYQISETETLDHVVSSVNGNTNNKTASVTVTAGQLAKVDFVNAQRGTGNLMITKEIVHTAAGVTPPASILAQTFDLTIDVGTALAGRSFTLDKGNSQSQVTIPADGKLQAAIQHGQTLELLDLPEGTVVTVTENLTAAQAELFAKSVRTRDHSGATQDTDNQVTIFADANATAIIENKYTPKSVKAAEMSVDVSKSFVIEATTLDQAATFTFQLQEYKNSNWTVIAEDSVTYAIGESGIKSVTLPSVLQSITYTQAGEYAYRIVEKIPDAADKVPGVAYDRTTHTFTVEVVDNNGQLEATVMNGDQVVGATHAVSFTNTYHVAPASLNIEKQVENTAGNPLTSKAGFGFEAYVTDENWNPVSATAYTKAVSDATGSARLAGTHDTVGTYHFMVKERNDGKPAWSYDNTQYRITVTVTEEASGNLVASLAIQQVTFDDAGNPTVTDLPAGTDTITFRNSYDPADVVVRLNDAVRKQLTGRPLVPGEFAFAVYLDGQANTGTGPLFTGTNNADGSVLFYGDLRFDKVGTYKYDIVEWKGSKGGVTYDSRIFDLVVEVTDNGNGALAASYYFEDATGTTVTFNNTYKAADTTYTVSGDKILSGRPLLNDEFTFVMTEVADANGTPLTGGQTWTTTNTVDGKFYFPTITYTQTGVHYYKVSEKLPDAGTNPQGVAYDDRSYVITVTVTDNGDGQLVAVGSDSSNRPTFTNRYVAANANLDIPGTKILDGKVLGAGDFSFRLYQSNDSWEKGSALGQPVTNGADGKFQFPALTYSSAGTYYYLIEEDHGGETIKGITYDDTVFGVRVVVTDNLRGQLLTASTVFSVANGTAIPEASVQFVNTYAVTGDAALVLEGSKTLTGRNMTEGEFTFQLYAADDQYKTSGDPIKTAVNTANGAFRIQVDYTTADLGKTFYYVLKEQNADTTVNGVTYDSKTYNIQVSVVDDGDGTMSLATTVNPTATVDVQTGTNGEYISTVQGIAFANTYTAASVPVTFEGTKQLTGKDMKVNDFSFELYKSDANFVIQGEKLATTRNAADGSFTFPAQTLTEAGLNHFVIVETNGSQTIDGITYDAAKYGIAVPVTDDLRGQLHARTPIYTKYADTISPANAIAFTNTYDADDATVAFKGIKVLEGRDLQAEEFSFTLGSSNADFTTFTGITTVKNAAGGTIDLGSVAIDKAGTYYYQVKEVTGTDGDKGITFDKTLYNITVVVTDNGSGKLIPAVSVNNTQAAVAVEGTAATVSNIRFVNTYKAAATTFSISGTKELNGIRQLKDKDFTFQIFKAGFQGNITGSALQTVQNDASGKFSFTGLPIEGPGNHLYVIQESTENPIGGVTYDTARYRVQVVVTDNYDGTLTVSDPVIHKELGEIIPADSIIFTNKYDAKAVTTKIQGKKVLNGRALLNGEFTFSLQQTDAQHVALEGKQAVQMVSSGDGSFAFDGLTFTQPGTYYFTVTEVENGLERMTYDDTEYYVSITVTDDEAGQLVAAAPVIEGADEIVFTNTFTPKPDDLQLTFNVKKTVKNTGSDKIGPEGFTFIMEETPDAKLEATTDENGDASFGITVTEDHIGNTYTLKVYEKAEAKANVTYSDAVYTYVISVTLSDDNKLVADVTCNGKAVDSTNIVAAFENVYNYTPPATPFTGDNTSPALWFSLLAVSAMALAAAVIFRKKILA